MEFLLSKNQVQEFLNNPVWLQIKSDLADAIEDGVARLRKTNPNDATEIAAIQSGLDRIDELLSRPELYLAELTQDEELNENAN